MAKFERINPDSLAAPVGFSHAVLTEGKRIIFLAGQTSLTKSNKIGGQTITEQFEIALTNLLVALTAAGGTGAELAKVTIFATDPADYRAHAKEIGKVWQRLIGKDFPAMTLVGVTRLWDDAALIEIEGIAVLS